MSLEVFKNSLHPFVFSVFFAFFSLWNLNFLWLLFSCFLPCRSSRVNSSCEICKVWARFCQNPQGPWPCWGRCWCTNLVPHPHEGHQLWGWQGQDHGRSHEDLHQAAGEAEHDFAEEAAAPNGTVAVWVPSPGQQGAAVGWLLLSQHHRLHHLETPEHTDHLCLSLNPGTKSSMSLMLMSFEPTNEWCLFSWQLLGPSSSCFCCISWNFSASGF